MPQRNRSLIMTLFILIGLHAGLLDAQSIYKIIDKDGRVTYSESPPSEDSAAQKTTELDIDPDANVLRSEVEHINDPLRVKQQQRRLSEKLKQENRQSEHQDELAQAKRALADAKKALEAGQSTRAGDFIGRQGSGVRPSAQRQNRLSELRQRVEIAEQQLNRLKREKP